MKYSIAKSTTLGFDEAVTKVTAELAREGFGVLTTIDVRETLKQKLGVDTDRYIILGACNPPFAHQALQTEEEVGLLLPCNVIVYEKRGAIRVAAFDPMIMTAVMTNPAMKPIADEVRSRLERVIAAV
jgi:uncharacterized protein (DUF302 family)